MLDINGKIQISIIIPVYNEEDNIEGFYFRLISALREINSTFELIFIDDGSKDKSFEILKGVRNKDYNIKIIRLTKNFGQAAALLAGFSFARGQIIVTIDADLQCIPEDIHKLLAKINEGFDAVGGFRIFRQDTIFRKLASYFMNKIMYFKTKVNLKDWGCSLTAIRKEVVEHIISYGKNARFIKPIGVRFTNRISEVEIRHFKRKFGKSKYNLLCLIFNSLDFLVNYSINLPKNKREIFVVKEII